MSGFFNPKSRGRERPKFALPESMGKEPRTQLYGQSIVESGIGILVNRNSTKGRTLVHRSQEPGQTQTLESGQTRTQEPGQTQSLESGQTRSKSMTICKSYHLFIFCLLLTFAAVTNSKITIASHNLHGYKSSAAYHSSSMQTFEGVWMAQEHWLSEQQLPLLQKTGSQFVARSGMEDALSRGILTGRPYGGVCISWSPKLDPLISPISNSKHKRVVGVVLKNGNKDILILCIYMPFYDASKRLECMSETLDAIAMMETIIEEHPNHDIIIGGDLNTELKGQSPFDPLWQDFMSKLSFASCDSLYPDSSFTYHHESLGQKKFNDHFVVSKSLLEDSHLSGHKIIDDGDNISDHLPILMELTMHQTLINTEDCIKQQPPAMIKWDKLTDSDKSCYTRRLSDISATHISPIHAFNCHHTCVCDSSSCHQLLQAEYDHLIHCLKDADKCLPRFKPGTEKDWWTEDLALLRNKSKEIHSIWQNAGRPRHGPLHMERLGARAAYKRAIRNAQRAPKQKAWDRMHSNLAEKDTNSFWQSWRKLYNKNKGHLAPVVGGCSSEADIANCFKDSFVKNSQPNSRENVAKLEKRFTEKFQSYVDSHKKACDCKSSYISLLNVIDAIGCMKKGKCADSDGISAEHFLYAPLNILVRITHLFNAMLGHAFVPKQFHYGELIPVLKDHLGNRADVDNYRGITISPQLSKFFEHSLKIAFGDSLFTSSYQFGFKKGSSTTHALHCLKETVNYYVNNGSRVFCSFLDASKAFDRLVHSGLFIKLMNKNIPYAFLLIIINWYGELFCRVKWGGGYSDWFEIKAGVRQGGVLSPDFYSIYVDELIAKLQSLRKGCFFLHLFAAALFYADDMAILAPSIHALQCLLDVCANDCDEWDICLNVKKTKNLYFGKKCHSLHKVHLKDRQIKWVEEWKYLGVTLKQGTSFNCSIMDRIKKFYRCSNAIFRIDGRSNDTVMLQLVESHCVPLLTNAIEIIHVANQNEKRPLRVAYNSLFRKIFDYRRSQSVTELQHFLSRPTWEELVTKRVSCFNNRLSKCNPDSLAFTCMN